MRPLSRLSDSKLSGTWFIRSVFLGDKAGLAVSRPWPQVREGWWGRRGWGVTGKGCGKAGPMWRQFCLCRISSHCTSFQSHLLYFACVMRASKASEWWLAGLGLPWEGMSQTSITIPTLLVLHIFKLLLLIWQYFSLNELILNLIYLKTKLCFTIVQGKPVITCQK